MADGARSSRNSLQAAALFLSLLLLGAAVASAQAGGPFCPPKPAPGPGVLLDGNEDGAKKDVLIRTHVYKNTKVEIWCIDVTEKSPYFLMRVNGDTPWKYVGKCMWKFGANTVKLDPPPDPTKDLKSTKWESVDADSPPGHPANYKGTYKKWIFRYNYETGEWSKELRDRRGNLLPGGSNQGPPDLNNGTWLDESFCDSSILVPQAGHHSLTFDFLVASEWDFKEGAGVHEPGDTGNPCPGQLLLGLRAAPPVSHYYDTMRVATNLKGPGFQIDGITPIMLVPCPLPVVPPQEPAQTWFSGVNWRLGADAMATEINLCSGFVQSTEGGCIPDPESVDLDVARCDDPSFGHDNTDGMPDSGVWDTLGTALGGTIWGDSIAGCTYGHAHDYTATVTVFDVNYAAQGFDIIQNSDIVHPGAGEAYAVICWGLDFVSLDDFDSNGDGDTDDSGDIAAGGTGTASTHDWKLILDVGTAPDHQLDSVLTHLNPLGPNFLQGLYSGAPGAGAGNGDPCPEGDAPHDKSADLIHVP